MVDWYPLEIPIGKNRYRLVPAIAFAAHICTLCFRPAQKVHSHLPGSKSLRRRATLLLGFTKIAHRKLHTLHKWLHFTRGTINTLIMGRYTGPRASSQFLVTRAGLDMRAGRRQVLNCTLRSFGTMSRVESTP